MLRLRPFRNADAREIVKWTNSEDEFYRWNAGMLGPFPLKEERLLESTSARNDDERYFPFTAFDESGPVGFFTIRILGEENEIARFGFVILAPGMRGRGYGRRMLELGGRFALEIYGAKKLSLGVFDNNPAAYHCYRSLGYAETGEIKKYTIRNEEWNCIEMEKVPSSRE